jgi:hypothetical protein
MGMFDFLLKRSTSAFQGHAPLAGFTHKRFHARYLMNDRDLCTVTHSQWGLFRVIDLSHHGCLVESVVDSSFELSTVPMALDLTVCGALIRLEVSQCQRRKNGWGLVFKHGHESSIRSLSHLIEPIRYGSTAVVLPGDAAKDGLMAKYRRRFQGDGPFDLVYEKDDFGQLVFMMATIRRGAEYGSVIWEKGLIVTKKSIDNNGDGARMGQTSEVDKALVWACAAACLGMKFTEGAQCARALNEWLSIESQRTSIARTS